MKNPVRWKDLWRLPLHPFFLSTYPPLALLLTNISEVRFSAAIRSILVLLISSGILVTLLRMIYRNRDRAAFLTTTLLLLFFSFGHVVDQLHKQNENLKPDLWIGLTWIGLGLLCVLWAGRKKTQFGKVAPVLNTITLGLVVVVCAQVAWSSTPKGDNEPADEFAPMEELRIPAGTTPPDIYYIILDSYGRSDLLRHGFDFDNSQFLANLEAMGFYVAECTQSNYNRTDVSMASSLNLDYLQNLSADYEPPSEDRRTLWASIDDSTARIMLEKAGYTSIAFMTGFAWSEVVSSDVYLGPNSLDQSLSSFEVLLLRTTPARYLEDSEVINLSELDGKHFRERTNFILDEMDDLAHMPGPKFVFIHILPPHPPFVFAPDGSFTDPAPFLNEDQRFTADSYTRGYRNQVEYITGQIETAVQTLLSEFATPPIIVLQGDHAPWLQTGTSKFLILNAYYLPGHTDLLYPTISPVNTFRLIFNTYLGGQYELLQDTSYYSPVPNIYEFQEFKNPCLDK